MDTNIETFHAHCLMSSNAYNCPVCYHKKNQNFIKNSVCMRCGNNNSLWLCIFCAHVGCGHDSQDHAYEHYKETTHNLAMEFKSFNVWDYKLKKSLHNLDDHNQTLHSHNGEMEEIDCSCLLCCYMRIPKLLKKAACMKCDISQTDALWMCLFCSHIGCGRDYNRHALEHYTKTKHPYCMQLNNFSIWDYKEHKYLHRKLDESILEKDKVVGYGSDLHKQDFKKRMDRLEHEWLEFCKLTEANKKIITIEERLLTFSKEKEVLEANLHEHDAKLKKLLQQFMENRKQASVMNHSVKNDFHLFNIKTEHIEKFIETKMLQEISNRKSDFNQNQITYNPAKSYRNFQISKFISLMILGLFVYHSLMLILKYIIRKISFV